MSRSILPVEKIHPAIRDVIAEHQRDILAEVKGAIESDAVVVVGMQQNPFPRKARKLLDGKGIAYRYLEYGSYLSDWRRRNALKMWTGWPTFPMIFVRGTFVGGFEDLRKLAASGELETLVKG